MPALEQNEQDEAGLPSTLAKPSIDSKEGLLIRRIQGGEMDAFYELVRPCERAVFLVALTLLKNDADAEEVAQEAVLKAFQNIARFRQEAKFSTWLIQICINEAKMKLRKDRRHLYGSIEKGQQDDEGDYIPKDFADWREIPSEALEQKELREALTQALNSLPEKYRTVLILRDIQHLSINETAEVLDLSESNVKTRLLRARLQIRDALAPGFDGAWSRGRAYEKLRPFWTSDSNAVRVAGGDRTPFFSAPAFSAARTRRLLAGFPHICMLHHRRKHIVLPNRQSLTPPAAASGGND